jgi:RNA recognition motif-containing protein
MKARELKQQVLKRTNFLAAPTSTVLLKRHYEPCFTVMVSNLPPIMDSSQLQLFLSQHGKVCCAEVHYCQYCEMTKCSQGIGLVTMSTMHAHPEDVLDGLNALFWDGFNLEFTFIKWYQQRCASSTGTL